LEKYWNCVRKILKTNSFVLIANTFLPILYQISHLPVKGNLSNYAYIGVGAQAGKGNAGQASVSNIIWLFLSPSLERPY
jgi:hypothetical protein